MSNLPETMPYSVEDREVLRDRVFAYLEDGENLADFAERIGLATHTIHNLKYLKWSPNAGAILYMSQVLGCSTDYLYGLAEE